METLLAAFVGYACILAIGDSLTALLPRDGGKSGGGERIALAFALGIGAVSLLLFWGSLVRPGGAGIWWVLAPTIGLLVLRWPPWRWYEWAKALAPSSAKCGSRPRCPDWWAAAAFLALGAAMLSHLGASLARDLGGDGLAIYGIKARAAFVSGGMPTSYLVDAYAV